jgi:hypothetical protein
MRIAERIYAEGLTTAVGTGEADSLPGCNLSDATPRRMSYFDSLPSRNESDSYQQRTNYSREGE